MFFDNCIIIGINVIILLCVDLIRFEHGQQKSLIPVYPF